MRYKLFNLLISRRILPAAAFVLLLAVAFVFSACKKKNLKEANVAIVDVDRHYYPVIQGEILPINYDIENTSDVTLVIQEIQTSCGCLVPFDDLPIMVLPGKKNTIRLGYNSIKNTGFVEHQVYLYGNFTDSTYRLLTFDTNVVPPADYTRDYEVLFHDQVEQGSLKFEDLVDGTAETKGYYTDEEGDIRENTRMERQKKADKIINATLKR